MEFTWFDIIVVIFILLIGFKGIINGFIKEVFALIGIVGGIFLASRFAQNTGNFINANIYELKNEAAVQLVGFIATLLVVWLFCFIVGMMVSAIVNMDSRSSMLNKILGFVLSSIKIFLIVSILIFALSNIEFIRAKMFDAFGNSFMYQTLQSVGEKIVNIKVEIPENLDVNVTENIVEPIVNTTMDIVDTITNMTVELNATEEMASEPLEEQ